MQNLSNIKMLILDVDGVLTDGTLVINTDGSETKFFNSLDGHGIKMWKRSGHDVAILSGRLSEPTTHRAKQLEIEHVFQDCHDKLPLLKEFLKKVNLAPEEVAYIGDDIVDLPSMRYVGFSIAVANAVDAVKEHSDLVTTRAGGDGAVREAIEYILKKSGKWQTLMEKYLA
ncbi:MAG: HAD hydrolase family protein [Sedimentisphaerales bacterium]|nr:HAD hydrolase family protein [Sedimentisphaerales bacterium]